MLFAAPITIKPQEGTAAFKITDVGILITRALQVALLIAGLLVFVYLVLGGIQWITSGGDKGKTESARNQITAALVGLAIVAAAFALIQVIGYFFGFDITRIGEQLPTAFEK